jgi:hypothetical protein
LRGEEEYGIVCGPKDNGTFAVKFDQLEFNEFKFATGDNQKWLIAKKEDVYPT